MGSAAAVGIHDDLAAGEAGVTLRTADNKAAGRVNVNINLSVKKLTGKDRKNNLVNNILKRDIEQRHNIKYVDAFERLAHHLMNVAPVVVVENELANVVAGSSQHDVSDVQPSNILK